MKIKFLLFIYSCCILSTTYAQKVLSLYPLFTEQDAMLIPGIEGLWSIPEFDMTVSFQKAGDNFYLLKYSSAANPTNFEAVFVKIKGEIFLDLHGSMPDTLGDDEYRSTFVTGHSLFKISMKKDTLQLYESNYQWFYDYALKDNMPLKYEWVQNAMLLTLQTGDLKLFLTAHCSEQDIFKDTISLISRHAGSIEKPGAAKYDSAADFLAIIPRQCNPEFPLKDGWLGGDGDVSVPINATTTLFIFSDTYVGNKNHQSRKEPGMKMVSNSVAIQTCLPGGAVFMKYYWNNMYAENPGPIFKSYTSRYKYWVQSAFMIKDNLYVVLQKVGSKLGASPGDIFSFSLLGFTLAKISNPYSAPNEWKIEYILLPGFGNPFLAIGPSVKLDNYIYFFVSRFDKAQVLVRKKIDFIDDPEKPFEYYALSRKWKEGLNPNDMDTIVNGFRSNTVNYHPEMKQWVMICDIKFMDNKIKMRTAPALTGPWSDEVLIYEIPEVTPGNPAYSKSNFCYLARECIQNYNSKKHTMLLTYDTNNSDFSEIKSNPKIYTPKVISVPLKLYENR